MSIDIFWLHAAIMAVAIVGAYAMHRRTRRLQASFELYRIRDQLILLVAKEVLPEESIVFRHYYNRINALLQEVPHVGIDHMLEKIFRHFEPSEFPRIVSQSKHKVEKLASDPLLENPEVRAVIADYYWAVKRMMLCHSSILRVAYIISSRLADGTWNHFANAFMPAPVRRGVCAVDYAHTEAKVFSLRPKAGNISPQPC